EPARPAPSAVHGLRQGGDRTRRQEHGTDSQRRADPNAGVSATIDPFILEKAPGPLVEIPAALVRARQAFAATLDSMAAIGPDRITCRWDWDEHPADIRYSFYRVLETCTAATSAAGRALASDPSSEARDAVGAAAASRWAIHGVLATLSDADLDAD